MSQEDGKSAAETCDGVIEQSDGRKNSRKGQAKERKLFFFCLTLCRLWSVTIERQEMTFIHPLPVALPLTPHH